MTFNCHIKFVEDLFSYFEIYSSGHFVFFDKSGMYLLTEDFITNYFSNLMLGFPIVATLCHKLPQLVIATHVKVSRYYMLLMWIKKLKLFTFPSLNT